MARRQIMSLGLALQGGLVLFAFATGWLLGDHFWTTVHIRWPAIALSVVCALLMVAGAIAVAESKTPLLAPLRDEFHRVMELFRECTMVDAAVLSVLAGVGEEALFRGVLQSLLTDPLGPVPAIFLAAVVFGAFHLVSVGYAVGAALIGVYLGTIYWYTGNLLIPMLIHGLYDFALLVYALRIALPRKGRDLTPNSEE
jgi:hypothetical protein